MTLTGEQRAVRDVVREFAVEEIQPIAAEADETGEFPEDIWDRLADLDLTGLTTPTEYGGYGADQTTYAVVNEQVAYGSLAVATALSVHCLATACIATFGDADQKERWLPEMAEGRPVGAFALSEPDAGSNPAEMSTEARPVEGDDGAVESYVLDGRKQWITNGARAGVVVVFAKTDRADPNSITQFVVPADADGLVVEKTEDKMGLRASDTAALRFDGVEIPAENRLTEVGAGLRAALSILTEGRIGIAAQSVGLAQDAFDRAREYATEREQFDQPIAEIQSIRHKLAEMATQIQAARALTYDAAAAHERGREASLYDPVMLASMAKYAASETAVDVTSEAVQVHGGYGYVTEFEVERLYRDAKVTTIYEGTSEIQKTVIARHLLDE
ncbi:hypothetical protein SAMN06269185_0957 [Natronoarchaeum philippinense]|uniref:Acyl-CoA dehydrogenase n=1 Tax=Natronoarchaeum philippinense TaxID=558529 RepID=A0A285N8T0_NATPI|nr:acyl-CoA dehydrogenase family protein [Natronoarchaeum philippinense]SNZ05819.1 hypothetical protein SAMN06269185_0957 [Natronoarchaeum philippinense]